MRPIEEWIRGNLKVKWVTSAALRYDGMDHQAPPDLGGVYRPYTPARIDDWIDLSLVLSYLSALGTTGRILDIGTGDGWPALPLAPYVEAIVGIDQSEKRINTAEENRKRLGYKNVQFRVASGDDLPFPDGSFAGVVAGTAIEQIPDPAACLREVHRVLEDGGALVATVENLEGELTGSFAEEAELFPEGDRFFYRYAVKERRPPREAEYLIEFDHSPEMENIAAKFPRRPGFTRRNGEPGMQPLEGKIAEMFGLPFLKRFRGTIATARGFELHHFTAGSLREALDAAGFSRVKIRGPITRIASRFFIALHEEGLLGALTPRFEDICRALAQAWDEVPSDNGSLLFVQARKETHDRCPRKRAVRHGERGSRIHR